VAVATRLPVAVAVAVPPVPPVDVAVGTVTTVVEVAVGDPPPPPVAVAVAVVSTGVGVGVGGVTPPVLVGVGTSPTLTMPSVQAAGTAWPPGVLACAAEQVNGKLPVASAAIVTLQVYITTGQAGGAGHPVVGAPQIGQTLSNESTSALTAVVPWNDTAEAPLSMSGLNVQSGLPLGFVAIAALGSNVMLFCVPAIAWSELKLTVNDVVPPAGPVALPIVIVVPCAWACEPLTRISAATAAHRANILLLLLIFNPPLRQSVGALHTSLAARPQLGRANFFR
jgi:hypothetical protein